ncbi:MAG: hypothetical protein ABFS56_33480 [Pseudomonadota bacterium]
MLSIRGIYTGKEIKPLENVHALPNVRVIITFLDDEADYIETEPNTEKWESYAQKTPTEVFLDKCKGWKDTRSPEEIITEIYASRTSADRSVQLF